MEKDWSIRRRVLAMENSSSTAGVPMRELRDTNKPHINPSVLVIVIILSVVFLCSGILHILARCLGRRRARELPERVSSPSNSLRGQLQHLFSLHDSGVEQVFIDTLPVFLYGSIRGLKDSADCAVCLNEFVNEDKLRLLPKCKHAFHTECIDTWLLSNSTCPLCRRSLLPDAEPVPTPCEQPSIRGSFRASLRGSFRFLTESAPPAPAPPPPPPPPPPAPPLTPGPTVQVPLPDGSERTLRVELGKVNTEATASSSRMTRSYSMGSYEYVVDFTRPAHRHTFSDGIPELSSARDTPANEELFWASRGLDTPNTLSRVREIMTPTPGWCASPLFLKQKEQVDDVDEIKVEIASPNPNSAGIESSSIQNQEHPGAGIQIQEHSGAQILIQENSRAGIQNQANSRAGIQNQENASILQSSNPGDGMTPRSLSLSLLRSPTQEMGSVARKDKVWEVSVDVSEPERATSPSSGKKSSPLNWLRGRGRRLVYSAASPSATEMLPKDNTNSNS